MKCYKCNKLRDYFIEARYLYPSKGAEGQDPGVLFFCDDKCRNEWEASNCGKNYDTRRLKAIEEYIKEEKGKDHSSEPDDWEETKLDIWKEEAKKIRQKWNIKEEQPQERERERERERAELPI